MNSDLLRDIYRAKGDRRKRLMQLPLDEKMVIIERLRDMAIALRAAKEEINRKPRVIDEAEGKKRDAQNAGSSRSQTRAVKE